jgi:hypothetical protein
MQEKKEDNVKEDNVKEDNVKVEKPKKEKVIKVVHKKVTKSVNALTKS